MTEHKVEILLVDDRKENLFALEEMLAHEDYEFYKAGSGQEALKILLKAHDFAIILMDVQMPGMDGFETAKLIREREKFSHVPIIFLTAAAHSQEDIFRAYQSGAVDFIQKPVTPAILKAKVKVFVELYKRKRELVRQGEYMKTLNTRLQQQSHYVRSLIEASLDPIVTINSEGRITDMNRALTKITGYARDQIKGTYFFDYFTRPEIAREVYREVFEEGSITDYQLTIKHKTGKLTDVLFNGSVYKDHKGKVLGVVVVAREKILSKYSRSLIEASLDPLITINSDGKITDMNQALSSITGITREKIKGTDFFDYFTDPAKAREIYKEVFSKGYVVDFPLTIRHKDGKLTDVLFNGSVYKDDRGNVLGVVIVARDITRRKKFENELIEARRNAEKARQTAEEAVKAKQQFLSNMSHEIRTPLNAIIGFTKVLLKTDMQEKQKEYLNAIKISGDALIVLINDILDLAKVEAGKMKFEQIPFKLANSVHAMLHLFENKMHEKNLELVKDYDTNIPEVIVGDPVRLHQIILNLVSNAVKFTHKGKIIVSVRLLHQDEKKVKIEFAVTDTGIGIPAAKLDSIFDNFQQASSGTARVYGGTGLGLAIVKQLVTSQGGSISVKSKEGEGSTFSFVLGFKKTREKVSNHEEEVPQINNSSRNVKILVAEDVRLNQLLMKTLLEDFGYEMEIAPNGKIAVERMRDDHYDLILMDLQMPEMNGFTATEIIRREMKSNIPIIALTADVTNADVEKCRAVGMNDYVAKPIDERVLFNKINKYLQKEQSSKINAEKKKQSTMDNTKCTNLEFLKQLTKNNSDMISEMIKTFMEETPPLVKKMKEALERKDWESLRQAAHAIIPSFSTIGLSDDYTMKAKRIQEQAREQNPDGIEALVKEIDEVCSKAYEELQHELAVLG
jgi:PAS domain S-box-containing protein